MSRATQAVATAVLLTALSGCALKIGNTSASLLDGWNQPSVTTEKTEKVTTPTTTVAK